MIIRLLIAAAIILWLTSVYLTDETAEVFKPKEAIQEFQGQLDSITEQADAKRKQSLEEMGL